MSDIITKLQTVLAERKNQDASASYVASLYAKGDEAILKKITEEALEVALASQEDNKDKLTYEVADLYFHILVLLTHKNIKIDEIYQELERRFGLSGITEKNNRIKE
jgi:phosphoribosyl-ATP pyrophosphohydrolase